jgi:hypothetical protein
MDASLVTETASLPAIEKESPSDSPSSIDNVHKEETEKAPPDNETDYPVGLQLNLICLGLILACLLVSLVSVPLPLGPL